jgi:nucleoside-diphosphate-sugar epimerase
MLAGRGDDVLVAHRGVTEPADLPPCEHVHADRREFGTAAAAAVRAFRPDAVLDCAAMSAADVDAVLPHLPDVPAVVLSSMDVYRVWELMLAGDDQPSPVPLDEQSPLRVGRFPYRGRYPDLDDYDKLDVEPAYLSRGGAVLRLGMVYGPRDPQTREESVLRRVRAGRSRIPVGPATTVHTRLFVDDAAAAILAALDRPSAAAGQVFNVGDSALFTVRGWMRLILDAAGSRAELVTVSEAVLPEDLRATRAHPQHFIVTSAKATSVLGWRPSEPGAGLASSVPWHLAHPPQEGHAPNFAADDAALAAP